jgi:hypothetical protein
MTEYEKLKFASEELTRLYEKKRKKRWCSQLYLANLSSSINALHQAMETLRELTDEIEGHYYEDDDCECATISVKHPIHASSWWYIEDWKGRK